MGRSYQLKAGGQVADWAVPWAGSQEFGCATQGERQTTGQGGA